MKVSAIVSAYYAEQFIRGRLENLLMQNPMPEIVVVCKSGSMEHETAVEMSLDFASHGVFQIIKTRNVPTIYEAWNMGIKKARGDYVTNANSDDRLKSGALARMAQVLGTHPEIGLVFTLVDWQNERGNTRVWHRVQAVTGEWKNALEQLRGRAPIGPMPMWRKALHEKHGYFGEYKYAGDYEWWLRIAKAGERFWYIADNLGVYLSRPDSLEHRNKAACDAEAAAIKELYRG